MIYIILCSSEFSFGDPHFKTIDNRNFTFNGIGEYILIETPPSIGFSVQARLQRFGENITGTVISAIVVKQSQVQPVQIESENNQMNLYIAGVSYVLEANDSPLVVGSSGVISDDLTGGIGGMGDPMAMAAATDQLFVRVDDSGSLVMSTAGGASVGVALQQGRFLTVTVQLPDNFKEMTSGLLGKFNDDPDDDFRDRNGAVLSLTSEREIFEQFGNVCK